MTSLALRLSRTAQPVRYAVQAAHAINQQEALRNYLLLVSRAYGLGPHTQAQPDHPVLQQLLQAALGGDHAALGAYHDLHEELTGEQMLSPQYLHHVNQGGGDASAFPHELLTGLLQHTLGTGFHEHPLDITSMFSRGGLAGVPNLGRNVQRMLPSANIEDLLRAMAFHLPGTPETRQVGGAVRFYGDNAAHTGDALRLPHLLDALHQAQAMLAQNGTQFHGARNVASQVQDMIGDSVNRIEEHHLG